MRIRTDPTRSLRPTGPAVGGLATLFICILAGGCAAPSRFPPPIQTYTMCGQTVWEFDATGDGLIDYRQYENSQGRKQKLGFVTPSNAREQEVDLDEVPGQSCPHFIIALDGVPFEVVQQLYDHGSFRLFHPPARVICGYPAMTDLALADVFHSGRCVAYQALYFDRTANRFSDGDAVYLSGRNSPWERQMAYRCSTWWDALVYLNPQIVFDHELRHIAETFRGAQAAPVLSAYSVGSAGLGTRLGRPGIEAYLRRIDELCERIVYERRGAVKITLLADHGHNLVENRLISFDDVLRAGGYRPAKSLHEPRDVVTVSYGLVTYAELFTSDPAGVAACLLQHPDVEFACYPDNDGVVVRDRDGSAWLTQRDQGYIYEVRESDPLHLLPVIEQLRQAGQVAPDGVIDEAALFAATIDQEYPDPLARLWRAFHGIVENSPDLIVNLRDGACHGWHFFYAMIGKVASTHGSLNRMNSTTFVMTMLGDLPPAMRSADVMPNLERLRGD